ncbi:MAG: helix-turn-helix domain-containing protein [Pseudomonadota bacterium]
MKQLVAFANAEGGRIIIGVNDRNRTIGVNDSNHVRSQLQDIAKNCDPPLKVVISSQRFSEKNVLILDVPPGSKQPYSCAEGYYLRVGASSQKMKRDDLLEFIKKVQPFCFDEQLCTEFRYPKDFDKEAFRLFLAKAGINGAGLKEEELLLNLGVATKQKRNLVFNNAGVLFFAKNPKKFIRQAVVTCLLLAGTDKVDILDRKDLEGNLFENVDQSIVFLKRHLSVRYKIEKLQREEILELPETALREAVLNAVTHRDYSQSGAVVMIEIYRDRVEIVDPGSLPPGIKKSELGKRSVHRNPIIADLFHRIGEVDKVGSGIRRIRQAAKEAKVPSPKFEVNGFFTVTFPKPIRAGVSQVSGQVPDKYRTSTEQVLTYCMEPRKSLEIQGKLGLKHRETFQENYLKPLVREGLIAMTIPDKPRSSKQRYVTTSKGLKVLKEASRKGRKK